MNDKKMATIDGNTAAAHIAYAFSEVAAIYPITPSSTMGELADEWAANGKKNIFGQVVDVVEMQSEAGASGAVHGSLSAGALTTTFTASQGLLLMIPNMHKIAGEMLPAVFHVAARALACQSLSIFGDQSDVMAVRNTGFALLAGASVQEVMDLAAVAHLSTLESRIPFVNFFDGFRTSSEIQKIEMIDYETLASMLDTKYVEAFRKLALNPDKPFIKTGAQNPDVYFQGRETVNKYYAAAPEIVQKYMDLVAKKTGRKYRLFDYVGVPNAEKIIISMGSACDTIEETVNYLVKKGEKVGAVKVRLYRPFSVEAFRKAVPASVKKIAVLDRTKEPGSIGEPLYLDVVAALTGRNIKIIGGRYGLSSKDFTPAMAKAVFDHLDGAAFHDFTVGITDDVSKKSLPVDDTIDTEPEGVKRCIFWGYGSDGTVGANKNSIKIIGDNTDMYVQGYFSYDSKKSGGITISYLRFGNQKIQAPYLINKADFIALHNPAYIGRYDILEAIKDGGTFLLNSEWSNEEVLSRLTCEMQDIIIKRKVKFYNINALKIAQEVGLGLRINTVMQAAFFKVSGVLEETKATQLIKDSIKKTYQSKGENIVKMNWDAVDRTSAALKQVKLPASKDKISGSCTPKMMISQTADEFAKKVIDKVMHLKGDDIPVSAMPLDGAIPTGTAMLEKRGIATQVPRWIPQNCIQCAMCAITCPHAAVRVKQIEPASLKDAPKTFVSVDSKTKNDKNLKFRAQVYTEDCTGCGNCINICPTKEKSLIFKPIEEERATGETTNAKYFDDLPDNILDGAPINTVKGSQLRKPLFEFSGACGGCGETPYLKLATQLFGERMIIANATGCTSIYSGTFPTIPYTKNKQGKGPAWANSLFEDNAEYGYGMRLAVDANRRHLKFLFEKLLASGVSEALKNSIKKNIELWDRTDEEALVAAAMTKGLLAKERVSADIVSLQDNIVNRSVWSFGGDGWAYDIGYGGLDHVLASNRNINILVLDTEVYSNTGGQASKSTPLAAVAKFAASGKKTGKKDLGLISMSYGYIYVASISLGANQMHAIKAFLEAEAYNGPSLIIAYAPCIAHGIDMSRTYEEEKKAVLAGYWPLYRYNPMLKAEGKNPFLYDTKDPQTDLMDFLMNEVRFNTLKRQFPDIADNLYKQAVEFKKDKHAFYKKLSTTP
ncbi:MAG: pyruvate:ferredoxin (flavodoxin) oxidoreductase [Candidatus Omnitrophica bacterium]|nr:pyruvate:ferredoxin (flavodoxin) oxidoreductase [Candidatus Omnitrophota bacterium]